MYYSKNVMEVTDPFHLYLASMKDMAIWILVNEKEKGN
jgi:hypothetical protein